MKAEPVIKPEEFKKIVQLRKRILHAQGPMSRVLYTLDEHPDSYHLAIYNEKKEVLACGSFLMEDESENLSEGVARIRGMAVDEKAQGQGLGGLILDGLLREIENRNISKVWCNARTRVLSFYLKRAFLVCGEEFVTPGGVPHYKLVKTIGCKEELK